MKGHMLHGYGASPAPGALVDGPGSGPRPGDVIGRNAGRFEKSTRVDNLTWAHFHKEAQA